MEREACLQGIWHISQKPYLLGSPVKEPSFKVPFMESLTERCPTTRALLHSSVKVSGIKAPPPLHTRFPLDGKGPPWRETPTSRDFPNISSRFPSEGAPPPRPHPRGLFSERRPIPEPPSSISQSPGRRALLHVPQTGPIWREMPVSRAFSTYPSGSPAREPSLQVPFTELPTERETLHLQSPFQPYLKIPGRWAHYRLPNWAPVHPQNLPFETFRAPRKGAPLQVTLTELPWREMPRFRSPITIISQSSRWYPSSGPSFPYPSGSPDRSPHNRAPAKRDAPLPEPCNCLKIPRQRTGSCPVAPCGASRYRRSPWKDPSVESLLESPIAELTLDSSFFKEEVWGPPSRAPILGKAGYIWKVAWYPRGCR